VESVQAQGEVEVGQAADCGGTMARGPEASNSLRGASC
jgi:hypothetical protein